MSISSKGFMFYGRPIKTILDFEVKIFCRFSIAFGAQKVLYIHSWHTNRFLYHSKQTKNEEDV
jgi:hypothetical protein